MKEGGARRRMTLASFTTRTRTVLSFWAVDAFSRNCSSTPSLLNVQRNTENIKSNTGEVLTVTKALLRTSYRSMSVKREFLEKFAADRGFTQVGYSG